ncbi:lecithin retinol acyltransferase b, tandem duplicate 2 [Carassius auratus]|uniref:Lecithin retinol acyltransferase b, tandem duplicate 2 n=1 Tax=Carassius auratus TaxID=7957 RepID=A0A6P6JKQ3_CARAU|nr:lecithin retinol acyltransferase-like [Carassius auratus]XP_052400963.1 lecithin retinol acyltransferase b, tandem duplicate 2 [Carassius gibelio]
MFPLQFLYNFFYIAVVTDTEEKKKKVVQYDTSMYKRGDLLEVPRTLFTHFGIYLGNNRVAHLIPDILPVLTTDEKAIEKMVTNNRLILGVIAKKASVRVDSLEDFAYGAEILVNHMDKVCSRSPFEGEEVARRAEKLLGSVVYSLLWYNCEHYVMYCRYGTSMSFQTYQFCKVVRKIVCSKRSCLLSFLLCLFIMFYMGSVSIFGIVSTFIIPSTIWMAS